MSMVIELLAIALKIAGVVFLFAAALGLLRFKDALQRMHASTKTGTIGAGLILAGTVIVTDSMQGVVIGILAILFLLLTVPVAAHLLGRAIYISGAELVDIEGKDALKGVLPRGDTQLARETSWSKDKRISSGDKNPVTAPIPRLGGVRFAIATPHEKDLAHRALNIAKDNGLTVEAKAIVDKKMAKASVATDSSQVMVKAELADAVATAQAIFAAQDTKLSMFYTEGDAEHLMPDAQRSDLLLILPLDWCHRVKEMQTSSANGILERLLDMSKRHAGPVLFSGTSALPKERASVLVIDDGSDTSATHLIWALKERLWVSPVFHITGGHGTERIEKISSALAFEGVDAKVEYSEEVFHPANMNADVAAHYDAVFITSLPQQYSNNENGLAWLEHLVKDGEREVLVTLNL